MLTLFADIKDIRHQYMSSRNAHGHGNYFTENDFRNWLFSAIDFLGIVFVDFQFDSGHRNQPRRNNEPVTNQDCLSDLYLAMLALFDYPELNGREVSSCIGFLNGDLLYFHMEFTDE